MSVSRLEKSTEFNALLVSAVKPIRVLSALRWPLAAEAKFLDSWRSGRPLLPNVQLEPVQHDQEIAVLKELQSKCDRAHPLDNLIFKTARSYETAARVLGAMGTPDFTRYSIELYGKPDDSYKYQDFTALDAAEFFLHHTEAMMGGYVIPQVNLFDSPRGRMGNLQVVDLPEELREGMEASSSNFAVINFLSTSDKSDSNADSFGHSYFRNAPTVSSDLILMLRDDLDPGPPGRPLEYLGSKFWRVPPGYPAANPDP